MSLSVPTGALLPGIDHRLARLVLVPLGATGLSSPDIFYFGNLAGDVTGDLYFTPIDSLTVIDFINTHGVQFVGVDSPLDVSGDGVVSSLDVLALTNELNSVGNKSLVVIPEPATMALMALGGLGLLKRRK